jgi:hypothetical protein
MTTEALVKHPYPEEAGYDPARDAPVLSMGGEYIRQGRWAGKYRTGGHLCDAWGNMLDEGACPGCLGARRVKQRTNTLRPWESEMVPCPRCS